MKIVRGKYDPIPTTYSKELKAMVDMCLIRDFKKRPGIETILQNEHLKKEASALNIAIPT